MSSRALRVSWYRFRVTVGRRWGGYLALILLVGLVGGVAMGSIAAARRTQSSFPTFLESVHPAELQGPLSYYQPGGGPAGAGYDPSLIRTIARQPHVSQVEVAVGLNTLLLGRDGAPVTPPGIPAQGGESAASVSRFGYDLDRLTVLRGRMPRRSSSDEMVMTPASARTFHLRVGDRATFGLYTDAQTYDAGFGTAAVRPVRRIEATLVGIVVRDSQVVEDEADVSSNADLTLFGPAVTHQLLHCCAFFTEVGVKVTGGPAEAFAVQNELSRALPTGTPSLQANPALETEDKAERAIKPESIALGVFGTICALAALLIGAQLIGRQLRLGTGEERTLRALGADPTTSVVGGLIGILGSVVVGAVVAAVIAVGLSPLAPLGPVRVVDPSPGMAIDWTVLGIGILVLIAVLERGERVRGLPAGTVPLRRPAT